MTMTGSILGNSVHRKEDPGLLRGTNDYFADLKIDGMAHAVMVRSTIAHAEITELDISEAESMPGVVAVWTSQNTDLPVNPAPPFIHPSMFRPTLATDRVRLVGDIVAVVVAETEEQAKDAAEMVIVDYEPLDAVVDIEKAIADDAPVIWPEHGSNVVFATEHQFDKDVLAGADVVVSERVVSQRLLENLCHFLHDFQRIEAELFHFQSTRFDFRKVQDVVDQV